MEIWQLDPAVYAGRKFTARYRTKGYYDICAAEDGFRLRYVPLGAPMEKSFDDEFFGEWLEEPVAFGAFEGERLLGYVEGAPEGWNNRYRISNICIFEENARGKGLGTLLMQTIQRAAEAAGVQLFVALIENLPTIIVEIVKAVPQIIAGIVKAFGSLMYKIVEIGARWRPARG